MHERDTELTGKVIGLALEVHKELGPGLLESAYEKCLAYELTYHGIQHELQKPLPLRYKKVDIDCGYRLDFLVEGNLIVELKSVESLKKIHEAQLLTYMKLAEIPLGLLINFNTGLLKNGIKRFVL
jgi:GxxExxY protein